MDDNGKRRHLKPWKPGCKSPNPSGRPKGAKNKTTMFAEALLQGEAEAIVRKTIDLALAGDVQCLKICMDRLIPPKKQVELTGKEGGALVVRIIDRFGNGDSDTP